MVYKTPFSFIIYLVILVLGLMQHVRLPYKPKFLKLPQVPYSDIIWQQGPIKWHWQRLKATEDTWVLNAPDDSFAVQVAQPIVQNTLAKLGQPIPLDMVVRNITADTNLVPYGLSVELRTVVTLQHPHKTAFLTIGNRTPGGQEIFVLVDKKICKAPLDFLFSLLETTKNPNS